MFTRIVLSSFFLVSCGASAPPDASGDGSDDGSGGAEASDGDAELTHGKIVLAFRRAQNQASSPSVGTARVSVTMTYRECLGDLYDANPSLRQDGPDGELVFGGLDLGGEGWRDRLCAPGLISAQADCTVLAIEQRLDPVAQLTVTYGIAGEVENHQLAFGPLPTSETAGCPDPIVRASVGGIKGYDADGNVVWEASGIEPLDAVTDQGGELTVQMQAGGD